MKEIWRPIPNAPNYVVSNLGNVKNIKTQKCLKPQLKNHGYYTFRLYFGSGYSSLIKRANLVGNAFLPNPLNLPILNHKDLNKTNDGIDNLVWVTYKENSRHWRNNSGGMKKHGIKIYCYDKRGAFIGDYISIKEASDNTGVHPRMIRACCNNEVLHRPVFIFTYKKGLLPVFPLPPK